MGLETWQEGPGSLSVKEFGLEASEGSGRVWNTCSASDGLAHGRQGDQGKAPVRNGILPFEEKEVTKWPPGQTKWRWAVVDP